MTSLTFGGCISSCYYMWPAVQFLFCQAPKVQTLVFELTFLGSHDGYPPENHLEDRLEKWLYVPECLSSHLTVCYNKEFSGHEVEMNLFDKS